MPYRQKGKEVQVKRGEKWVTLKTHKTKQQARAHLFALRENVRDKGKKK